AHQLAELLPRRRGARRRRARRPPGRPRGPRHRGAAPLEAHAPPAALRGRRALRRRGRRRPLPPGPLPAQLQLAPAGGAGRGHPGRARRLREALPVKLAIEAVARRAVDVAASASALVLLGPVLAATAAAVRISLGAPVLFRQRRPGLHGAPFELVKFRTM